MSLSFFDDDKISDLYPLTLTRPAGDLRCGLLTVAEKWSLLFGEAPVGYETRDYLTAKFPAIDASIRINGRLLINAQLIDAIEALQPGQALWNDGSLLAEKKGSEPKKIEYEGPLQWISRPYDLFLQCANEIQSDILLITRNRHSEELSKSNQVIGNQPVFLEAGAKVECSIINTEKGPVYIGKNAEIMEGCMVRGPFAMSEGSVLKMGAKVYGPTALGPYTVIGGEVNNIQVQGYSNKGHDGFLGNAVLGEWCNIGADSNCSNLKNNYEDVKVWNYSSGRFEKSGQQFCGLIMGDHSKCGINTMFNTGTVVGVSANIFGSGFPRNFVPDFAWGGASGFITYKLDAACKTASLVMPRRKKELTPIEQNILETVFEMTKEWRNWE